MDWCRMLLVMNRKILKLSSIFFITIVATFYLISGSVFAQNLDTYDAASAFCKDELGGTVSITSSESNTQTGAVSGEKSFDCYATRPGKTCDRFQSKREQEGCAVASSDELIGLSSENAKSLFDKRLDGTSTVGDGAATQNNTTADAGSSDLNKLLQATIDTLSAAAGLIFVISFIIAGFQYLTARDNASQVADAKQRIFTLVITFILFVFGYGLLQWLVPGGIFG